METEGTFKSSRRFFTSPILFACVALVMGVFALLVTLSVLLQPPLAQMQALDSVIAIGLWIFAGILFNFWRKWKVVYAWTQDRTQDREIIEGSVERIDAYIAKVDAGELPAEPLPPEVLQDWQDMRAAWRRELLRQEGLH